MELLLVVLP